MKRLCLSIALAAAAAAWPAAPAVAGDPIACVTYDFAGSELCVSDQGVSGLGPLVPGDPIDVCVIYTFSGAQICVNSDGEVHE